MKKIFYSILFFSFIFSVNAQNTLTPEALVQLNKVSGQGITKDGRFVIYRVSKYDLSSESKSRITYKIPIEGGEKMIIDKNHDLLPNNHISPNGAYEIFIKGVKLDDVTGLDFHKDIPNTNVQIYDELNYRHWDTWEDGSYNHVMFKSLKNSENPIDIMADEPYDCPQMPFGGSEDYLWSPDSENILYVTKKLKGNEYAVSTNTDIYKYNLELKTTTNLTKYNKGYDTQPAFSVNGQLAWLQMKNDGYEADKNDIIIDIEGKHINLTAHWDGTVNGFTWGEKGKKIYFTAPRNGTTQLFEIKIGIIKNRNDSPKQITDGTFDVSGIVGQVKNTMIVSRRDMNHASELYNVNLKNGEMFQLTHENDAFYNSIKLSKVEKRMVKTTDGKDMLTWVIYPPDFDPAKKYPTLLYCKGGPQGALTQSYSYRWNFQIMAAHGYIVVAPSRRGMSGFGIEWNEQISKDYGGQNMKDYLSAIDALAKEPFVDENRLGCVGASYGGYSAFYLAGIHEGRFKSFIAHDGMFNLRSMYGTTEEMFFVNWDLGGNYWDTSNKAAQKAFNEFNPINHVSKWDTPILIIQGGKDYRISIGQGLEAFNAAQLRGIKSKLLYFPEENHWVLNPNNSIVWQREFFKWLKETL